MSGYTLKLDLSTAEHAGLIQILQDASDEPVLAASILDMIHGYDDALKVAAKWTGSEIDAPDDEPSGGRLPTDAGDQLPKLEAVCAYRILPNDVVWGIEHDGGFHITEPFTCDKGALPVDGGRVNLGPTEVTGGRLMLVEVRR
jgi:hypothetical protein